MKVSLGLEVTRQVNRGKNPPRLLYTLYTIYTCYILYTPRKGSEQKTGMLWMCAGRVSYIYAYDGLVLFRHLFCLVCCWCGGVFFLLFLKCLSSFIFCLNGRMAILDNFVFIPPAEFSDAPCYSSQNSTRSCSLRFAKRQMMVWPQNMLRVLC